MMQKNKLTWRKIVSCFLVALLVFTNLPVFGEETGNPMNTPSNSGINTASLPDDPDNPVNVSLSVPAAFDTANQTELAMDLSLTVNTSGVEGLTVKIPLTAPDGSQNFNYNLIMEGAEFPEPITGITYTGSTISIDFSDDLPTGTYGPINLVFPFATEFSGAADGTVLWNSADVTVSTSSPSFNAALSSVTVSAYTPKTVVMENNVLTGLWSDNGTTDIQNVYAVDLITGSNKKTINYTAVLDGAEDTKTLEISLPRELAFQSTAPTSQQIPGIIDSMTVLRNSTTTGGTLKLVFDKTTTGLVSFDVVVALNSAYLYSTQNLVINNSITIGSDVKQTQTTLTMHDYTNQTVYIDPVPGIPPNNVQSFIYGGLTTTFSPVPVYSDGYYFVPLGVLKPCTLVYDLSRYLAVQDTAGGAFRPINKNEISVENTATCTYDPDTMQLTLTVSAVYNVASCTFNAKFNLPPGSTVRFGADPSAVSGIAYENNFKNIPAAVFTNFSSYQPKDYQIKQLVAEADIYPYRPYSTFSPAEFSNYITPNKDYESLFTIGATTYQTNLDNIRFKVNIPSNITITHIYAQEKAGLVEVPVKIYKDANDQSPVILSAGLNKLDVPISGVTSFEVEYSKFYANKSVSPVASNNGALRFFGRVSGNVGDKVTFGIDPNSITAVCRDIGENRITVKDMGSGNTFTTTLTDKKYYDVYFYSKQLLSQDTTSLISGLGPVHPGDEVYWGVTIVPDKTLNYMSADRNFYQPVVYFSVPAEFLPVNGSTFSKKDIYAALLTGANSTYSLQGTFVPYNVNELEFEIISPTVTNYNGGKGIIKISAPKINLYTHDNNLTSYYSDTDTTIDALRLFLKVKVDEDILVTKTINFNTYGQLVGTSYDKALGPGRGTSNNGIPEASKLPGLPAGERILFNGDTRSLTIMVESSATMESAVKPSGSPTYVSYDSNDPTSAPPISAGNYGMYRASLSNAMPTAINNAVGYFVFPADTDWKASIVGNLTPTARSITNGVSVYFTNDTVDGTTLQTNDNAAWRLLTATSDLSDATAVKIVVAKLEAGERYEAEVPFFVQAVNYETVNYGTAAGNTSYNMAQASVAHGKTAALELVQSTPPDIVTPDLGYEQGTLSISVGSDVSSINANILNATVTDDITGNITETPFKNFDLPMGLDMDKSTVQTGSGASRSFASISASGGNAISSSANETYIVVYKSKPDHDGQVSAVSRTIIVGTGSVPSMSTLSGIVYNSQNGQPISGAAVTVTDATTGVLIKSTLTDEDGYYSVTSIPTGKVVDINASAEYYTANTLAGEPVVGDAEKNIPLDPGVSSLSGTVTNSETGLPIPGAKVTVTDPITGDVLYVATTDNNGYYSIPNIPTGSTVDITVSADGYTNEKLISQVIIGNTDKDVQLDPGVSSLSGTVTDSETGLPIPGAKVTVTDPVTGDELYTAITDENGHYTIPDIPTGSTVDITVSSDGYADETLTGEVITGDTEKNVPLDPGVSSLSGTVTDSETGLPIPGAKVTVTDPITGDVLYVATTDNNGYYSIPNIPTGSTVDITVSADGYTNEKLTGQVIIGNTDKDVQLDPSDPNTSSLSGTVTDSETGLPIPGAKVTVTDPITGNVLYVATTDNNGYYSIPNIPTGSTVDITVSADGYTNEKLTGQVIIGNTDKDVQLDPSDPNTSSLSGTVTDSETGLPIPGAKVTVTDPITGNVLYVATTDNNGYYSIPNIPTGSTVDITVSADGYTNEKLTGQVIIGNTDKDVQLDPSDPNTSSLSGTVTDSETGLPIPGAKVTVTDPITGDELYTAITDENGHYTIPDIPTGSTVDITVSADGYTNEKLTGQVIIGNTDKDVQLDPGVSSLSGTVTDSETGLPIPGAKVTVTDPVTGDELYTAITDENGHYTIPDIPTGSTVDITISADGYADKTLTGEVVTGDTEKNVQLEPESTGTDPVNPPIPQPFSNSSYIVYYYDDQTSNSPLDPNPVYGITDFPAGHQLTEADVTKDLGAGWITAKLKTGYMHNTELYPVIEMGGNSVVKVFYKKIPAYPYDVKYYKDSFSTDDMMEVVPGIRPFTVGYSLTAADIQTDLGSNWQDMLLPDGYQHGTVQGGFPVISPVDSNNTVKVIYAKSAPGDAGATSDADTSGDTGDTGDTGNAGNAGAGPLYTYTIEYYDSASPNVMIGEPVSSGGYYPEGYALTALDLTNNMGKNWLNARRPDGYSDGFVQGALPVISATPTDNSIKVFYTKLPVYNYTVEHYKDDTSRGNLIAIDSGKKKYLTGHQLNAVNLTEDLGSDWFSRYKPEGYENGTPQSYPVISSPPDNVVKIVYSASSQEAPVKVKSNPKTTDTNINSMMRLMLSCCILAALAMIWREQIRLKIKHIQESLN